VILAAVSFLDDLKSLPSSLRFTCHAAAAVAVLFALGGQWSVVFGLDFSPLLFALCSLLALLCLTGYTNAFNFMDGINGLAAGQTAITGLGMALLTSVASCQLPVVSHPLPTPAPSISAKALTSDAPTSDNWQLATGNWQPAPGPWSSDEYACPTKCRHRRCRPRIPPP